MSTRHLPVSQTMRLGQSSMLTHRTGASTVAHRSLARRIADTVVAGCRNFAGLKNPERPQHLVNLSAAA